MVINGQNINPKDLSLPQLKQLDTSLEIFLFKQIGTEPFEPSYKNDPKHFKKLISNMVSFKNDLMGYFRKQYDNRYNLVMQHVTKLDEYDDYLYGDEWDRYEQELIPILEKQTRHSYSLGSIALALALGINFDHSPADSQQPLMSRAEKIAGDITSTTRKRVKTQIEAAMKTGESRAEFDKRLRDVFVNPYRGRFIAQQEALNAYIEGKDGLAREQELRYKIALSSQALDKICGGINGEVVPINGKFSNGFEKPLYHFGCRCDIGYSRYSDGSN